MSRKTALGRGPLTGRGALSNPPGRFEHRQTEVVDDGWYVEEAPTSVATSLEPDRARGIITTNDSPDIPFEQSINPYRGCEHGCIYCLAGDTPVLMADGSTQTMAQLRVGDAIYGSAHTYGQRRYVRTQVLAHWSVIKPAYRILLEDGTEVIAGGDHRFLSSRGWKFVSAGGQGGRPRPVLTTGTKLMGTGAFVAGPPRDEDYGRGYLCGLVRGAGSVRSYHQVRAATRMDPHPFQLAWLDSEAAVRAERWLRWFRIDTQGVSYATAGVARHTVARRPDSQSQLDLILDLIRWPQESSPSWSAGFLAGVFDVAGSHREGVLRITSTDAAVLARIGACLRAFGMERRLERCQHPDGGSSGAVRLPGGLREHLRFLQIADPASPAKRDIADRPVTTAAGLTIEAIEPLRGAQRLYDITTGTGDFIANGVVSHNCYARPSHAYMGLSSGLDFETRLFYKADAARTLEEELARPGYVCRPLMLGANTDPYQPVERTRRVTREILEVLERCRHPAMILTKSALVLRDLDLLRSLAADHLVSVGISITTLESGTKRLLEPRTASPQARVRALAALAEAGIPTGVMVAPLIPAITDHEMEAILAAAAEAGVHWAGYTLLRLPHEIKDLFREWLLEHHPDKAGHVMSLLQQMRGGRDNDPRFGSRMRGTGPVAQLLAQRFALACTRLHLNERGRTAPVTHLFRPPMLPGAQLGLPF